MYPLACPLAEFEQIILILYRKIVLINTLYKQRRINLMSVIQGDDVQ